MKCEYVAGSGSEGYILQTIFLPLNNQRMSTFKWFMNVIWNIISLFASLMLDLRLPWQHVYGLSLLKDQNVECALEGAHS